MKRLMLISVMAGLGLVTSHAAGRYGRAFRDAAGSPPPVLSPEVISLSPEECDAAGLRCVKAELRHCPCVLKAAGKILVPPPRTAMLSYFLPGRIAQVHVQVGDRVKKGQPLVTIECGEVAEALSDFFKAMASHDLAQLNLDREKKLAADGLGARKNLAAAETEAKVAEASLEAAEKRLHILGFNEDQVKDVGRSHKISPAMTLYAPMDGKVIRSAAIVGAMVDQSKEILTVVDPTLLWVDAELYERDVAKARVGQEVEVVVPAFPHEQFSGKVCYIGDTVNEETRTITVRTELRNDEERLKAGMLADVSLFYGQNGPVLTVPEAAVLEEGRQKIVFVRTPAGFVRRVVETGGADGSYQHVLSGLAAGEEVVVEGNHQLKSKLSEAALRAAHLH